MPINLIHTGTKCLETFLSLDNVQYAIISHTWRAGELSYNDWVNLFPSRNHAVACLHSRTPERLAEIEAKAGLPKIEGAIDRAIRDGYDYVWIDTVCINKESSAELSGAINSMFHWYSDAAVCYAYLADVHVTDAGPAQADPDMEAGWFLMDVKNCDGEAGRQFEQSRWWTRGWTLQEFLASKVVMFFSANWTPLGTKQQLAHWIPQFTTIHKKVIEEPGTIQQYSVAQRMSWVSDRQTTLSEDMAYCLLGLFDINMPMLYGEGEEAFQRFQKEIIKISNDQSIFAWNLPKPNPAVWTGILAHSPSYFRHCGSIVQACDFEKMAYSVTNVGLAIKGPTILSADSKTFYLNLACSLELRGEAKETANGSITQSRSQIPIWIALRLSKGGVYERGHVPKSTFHFESSYPVFQTTVDWQYMISMSARPDTTPTQFDTLHQNALSESSGIIVRNGFGVMEPTSGAYSKAWHPLAHFFTSLRRRGTSTLSHELVCSGNSTVVISISWNEHGQPQQQMVTKFHDPSRHIANILSNTFPISGNITEIEQFHDSMKARFQSFIADGRQDVPLVIIRRERKQDLHGRMQVVVDFVFGEKPPKRERRPAPFV